MLDAEHARRARAALRARRRWPGVGQGRGEERGVAPRWALTPRAAPLRTRGAAPRASAYDVCSPLHWTPNYAVVGKAYANATSLANVTDVASCCAAAKACVSHGCAFWQWNTTNSSCSLFTSLSGASPAAHLIAGAAAPPPSPLLNASDFYDLFNESCLNGWTMGNIAIAPRSLVRFYAALFSGERSEVLAPEYFAQMQQWTPVTDGWTPGGSYGAGLIYSPGNVKGGVRFKVKGRCPAPQCDCSLLGGCYTNLTIVGHPGVDFGSAIPDPGWLPRYNVSIALAVNSLTGLNTSMTVEENGDFYSPALCLTFAALIPYLDPTIPAIQC